MQYIFPFLILAYVVLYFTTKEGEVEKIILTFLTAIYWHDTWKGSHTQTKNMFVFIYRELNDGIGSKVLFKKFIKAQNKKFNKAYINKIAHCIVRHSRIGDYVCSIKKLDDYFFPLKSIEAKILYDIDGLDGWSIKRLNVIKKAYFNKISNLDPKLFVVGKWWVYNKMIDVTNENLHFEWAKKEFDKRKKVILKEIFELWNSLDKYIHVYDPKIVKYLKLNHKKIPQDELKDYHQNYIKNNDI